MYYHCSPVSGLTELLPHKPQHFDKDALVYMTTSLPMALMYGIRNFEYTYGYTKDGQIYYEEYFPDALRILYGGKSASLYECVPQETGHTQIPNEIVSPLPVKVLREILIPDVLQALLEQEQKGALVLRRYEQLSARTLEWILQAEKNEIKKRDLLHVSSPMAEYMKLRYPQAWEAAILDEKKTPEA